MAYKVNSIGSHTFITLNGQVALAHETSMVIDRANVAGLDTMILPVKGHPFVLQSVASAGSESAAVAKYQDYCDMVAEGLVVLKKSDVDYFTTYGQKVKVLAVQLLDVQIASIMGGNVSVSDTHLLTCQWQLVLEVPA